MPDNRLDDTLALPTYEDGEPTVELPKITDTAELPRVKVRPTARELMRYVLSSRLVQSLLIGNGFVLIAGVGLLIGYVIAMEAGVVPNPVPGIVENDPTPKPSESPAGKKEHATPTASSPSDWTAAVKPPKPTQNEGNPSTSASASTSPSASASSSASASASAQPETSPSATAPASPETTAPATTPSASAPSPTESSTEGQPTSPASDTATPPTGETGSASPEDTAETPVNP